MTKQPDLSLPARMRDAADTLEELSALYGYRFPYEASWSPQELHNEARVLDADTPQPPIANWDNCSGHVYGQEPA